ncbi:hypothetical protein OH77DRAFT_314052 [Trametes cingulata]|nr:hypothetical protein OH77DRAFT_314052 [Trametes cingulata]
MNPGLIREHEHPLRSRTSAFCTLSSQWLSGTVLLAMSCRAAVFQRILLQTLCIQRERFAMSSYRVSVSLASLPKSTQMNYDHRVGERSSPSDAATTFCGFHLAVSHGVLSLCSSLRVLAWGLGLHLRASACGRAASCLAATPGQLIAPATVWRTSYLPSRLPASAPVFVSGLLLVRAALSAWLVCPVILVWPDRFRVSPGRALTLPTGVPADDDSHVRSGRIRGGLK